MRLSVSYLSIVISLFVLHLVGSEDSSPVDGGDDLSDLQLLASGKRQHNIMRFGKRPDGHTLLRFGKRFFSQLPPYLAPYYEGPESTAPKRGHSIMRFGKRGDYSPPSAAHSFIRFGRGDEDLKRGGPHAMIHFGKREELNDEDKRAGQHSMLYFGKRDDLQDEDKRAHAMIHFGKRGPNSHAMIHFGKRSDEDIRPLDRKKRDVDQLSWGLPERALESDLTPLGEFSLLQPPFEYDPQTKRDAHSFLRFG